VTLVAYVTDEIVERDGRSTTHHPTRLQIKHDDDRLVAEIEERDEAIVVRVGPGVTIETFDGGDQS
jgi:hypothetical protein